MIIFNTTYHADSEVRETFVNFVKDVLIPKSTASGLLTEPNLYLIHHQHEEGGTSYSLQFRAKNVEDLNYWMENEGHALQFEVTDRFKDRVMAFFTVLEKIVD